MTDEEKAEEYVKEQILKHNRDVVLRPKNAVTYIDELKQAYLDGLAEGIKEIKKQWHDCFLSCSSPYCAGHFPAVKLEGELGNVSKHERE